MTFEQLKEKAHSLPLKPGVYIMQDKQSAVIYVGKAKALKNRVSQYFQDSASHTEKTRAMVSQIDHFDVIIADSEFEALVLECSLIKRHQPRYNILLKDDKGYPYIRLSVQEEYPRFSLANRPAQDGARYFGPYGSRGSTQAIIEALRAALRLPSCGKKFPRDIGKERPCLNYHMGQCSGYCRGSEWKTEHDEAVAQAVGLLEGRYKEIMADLTAEMERAAEELRRMGLEDKLDSRPNQLSGGQCQRVAIARAMVNRPRLLLADEPTGALDSVSGAEIMNIFSRLNDEGTTVLLITHERFIADCAKKTLYIRDGVLQEEDIYD